jgi:HJR/Mrr/RecB family endonuclease
MRNRGYRYYTKVNETIIQAFSPTHNFKSHTLAQIDTMTGIEFERYVASMLRREGYQNVQMTEIYDLGVYTIASKNCIRWASRSNATLASSKLTLYAKQLPAYECMCDQPRIITNSY